MSSPDVLAGLLQVAVRLEDVAYDLRETVHEARRDDDELLTAAEAAEMLRLSPEAFEKLSRKEDVPRVYLSPRVIRYSRRELYEWAVERTEPPRAEMFG